MEKTLQFCNKHRLSEEKKNTLINIIMEKIEETKNGENLMINKQNKIFQDNYVSNNVKDENKNQIQNVRSLDEEENNLKTKEERLNYINKMLYDLRPEGRIVRIIRSPNKEMEQICTIQIEILIFDQDHDDNLCKNDIFLQFQHQKYIAIAITLFSKKSKLQF